MVTQIFIFPPAGEGHVFVCCGLFVAQRRALFKPHRRPVSRLCLHMDPATLPARLQSAQFPRPDNQLEADDLSQLQLLFAVRLRGAGTPLF